MIHALILVLALSEQSCSMHAKHTSVAERGDHAMGFSHEKTAHHFLLRQNGGMIDASANDEEDTKSRDEIRAHMQHIARAFSEGDFELPLFIHDKVPPGVKQMKKMKTAISYNYEETDRGARVVVSSSDRRAIAAVHDFLRFQIKDHETGDPLTTSFRAP